ncbi:MAG: hypothetical protein A2741_01160 [Candidatus Zambryskibacteria bacterium RIFCSPHIGHO2_01_FULL_43_27]|uniref:Trigger factor n=1 Tax=Candidatus Zambryskibacteria bacterium RIFCSPLOWO2_01_FULL_43_17 TaxID=1802760 RepID=A0A1G2U561_9BACT|nr:MAG: hypothetical protein A2741_01160 [Candidatus Zambryskibacteria bacterium RIFCSPHIGHO2_01_FULL_43_27]OHB00105.1 MAG: hypothetical protein A3E93_02155 [Candidatus Zambryskibacteria bacterium RIFCSPHIGHO2_12_FULL_43_12b]OHB04636.1 MAG: hypothetical protein A2920_01740 [Candidatus Zambryskibacteria bacterium RIFCSPLOWO2_01_FULL_43_17]
MKKTPPVEIKKLPNSEIEIRGEIESNFLDTAFETTLERKLKDVEMPGFRKGKAPKELVLKQFGEAYFLEEAANLALSEAYPKIVEENKLRVIGNPHITLTKLARGNPLGFIIVTATVPEIKLPDYKKLAKEAMSTAEDTAVTEEEVENVLLEIRKNYTHMEMHKSGELKDHNHPPVLEKDLPELTDELAKKIGDFASVSDMRVKVKENMKQEKERKAKEKKRADAIEKIMGKTDCEIPNILIEHELEGMLAQFEGDVTRAGGTMEGYLQTIKKTSEDLKKEWRETAAKKAKAQLVMSKIAVEEKIVPDGEEVRKETEKILTIYPDADIVRARSYVAMMLTNEKVFTFLESLA